MSWIPRDIRYGLRMLGKRPSFTVAALLALGLGIGANTAIFSVFDAVLLRPLPYSEPENLIRLWETNPEKGLEKSQVSPVTFNEIRQNAESFQTLSGWWHPDLNLTSEDGEPLRVAAINATDDFFDVFGLSPAIGRTFSAGEDQQGQPRIAVVGHGLWQRYYGGATDILGRAIQLDGQDYEVVGVMPPGFSFPGKTEIWLPLGWNPANHSREARFFGVVGRLAPGVDFEEAKAEISALGQGFADDHPGSNAGWTLSTLTLQDDMVGDIRPALQILLMAVIFVLLIACANVANLLLAQAASREREVALRGALGAPGSRLARQFLTESLLLAIGGALLGVVLAIVGVRLLLLLAPEEIPRLDQVGVDPRMLLFTLGSAIACGLIFGLAPAWWAGRANLTGSLKEGTRTASAGVGGRRLRSTLVVSELALAVILLVAAGLLIRGFQRLLEESPGFEPAGVASFNLQLPRASYQTWPSVTAFYARLSENLQTLPGVTEAAATGFLPLEAGWRVDFTLPGRAGESERDQPKAQYHPITPNYFRLMGIPLLEGRDFDSRDTPDKPGVAIVNRAAAEKYWPQESPVGETIEGQARNFGPLGRFLPESLDAEIVGVVGNVKNESMEREAEPAIYFPNQQFAYRSMHIVVKASGRPETMAEALKQTVWALDPNLPVAAFQPLEEKLGEAVARRRFVILLLGSLALLSLALASIGTYGVLSYVAGLRRREMGIRLALGAQRGDIVRILVGQGMLLAGLGLGLGLLGARILLPWLRSFVYGAGGSELLAISGAITLLAATAMIATYLPARRAARTDPTLALRED